jgi:mono/diheme cytochrome c family protein
MNTDKKWVLIVGMILGVLAGDVAAADAPTFNKDVAPILFENCVSCHRAGEVAPFVLTSYKDAKKRGRDLAEVTRTKFMPPWKADAPHGAFLGERRLSEAQIATIKAWVDGGMIEGDAKDLPALPKFTEGWHLGEPDMIVKMPEAFTVPAEGRDIFRIFVIPMNLSEDKFVRAVEFRPSNRKVVHHALLFLDRNGNARKLDEAEPGLGYGRLAGLGFVPTGGLGGWAPGVYPKELENGVVRYLQKGSDLVIQTHFHPSGKTEQEQSVVGIYFAERPTTKILIGNAARSRKIDIPPGEKNYTVTASLVSPANVELVSITPHAHLICRTMKVWATFPDGKQKTLIQINDWDFNWQDQYHYKDPIKIPKGTKFDMEFVYDNSTANIRNPFNPPQRITHGEETNNEMAITFFGVVAENPLDIPAVLAPNRRAAARDDPPKPDAGKPVGERLKGLLRNDSTKKE